MNAPNILDATSKKLFRLVVSDLRSRSALRDVDAPAIARYCLAEQVARQALARVIKRAKTEGDDAWTMAITHGGRGVHADVRTYQAASSQAASFAQDLTITPRARAALREQLPVGPDPFAELLGSGVSS